MKPFDLKPTTRALGLLKRRNDPKIPCNRILPTLSGIIGKLFENHTS